VLRHDTISRRRSEAGAHPHRRAAAG